MVILVVISGLPGYGAPTGLLAVKLPWGTFPATGLMAVKLPWGTPWGLGIQQHQAPCEQLGIFLGIPGMPSCMEYLRTKKGFHQNPLGILEESPIFLKLLLGHPCCLRLFGPGMGSRRTPGPGTYL